MSREHFNNETGWGIALAFAIITAVLSSILFVQSYDYGRCRGKVEVYEQHNCTEVRR